MYSPLRPVELPADERLWDEARDRRASLSIGAAFGARLFHATVAVHGREEVGTGAVVTGESLRASDLHLHLANHHLSLVERSRHAPLWAKRSEIVSPRAHNRGVTALRLA